MSGDFNSGVKKIVDMSKEDVRKQVETFGGLLATQKEMADILGVCLRTVETYMADKEGGFCMAYSEAAAKAKVSLRRVQMQKALDGDNALLIWLGKQLLDQKDKVENGYDKETLKALSKEDVDLLGRVGVKID